jgi:hypothetical protein
MSCRLDFARTTAMACVLSLGMSAARAQDVPVPDVSVPDDADAPDSQAAEDETDSPPALAEPKGLVDARAAMNEAQFAAALAALDEALGEGQLQATQLQEVYRLQGETFVAIGKAPEAKRAFASLLALEPQATLGEFASPKIVAVLEEARAELAGGRLAARHQVVLGSRRLEVVMDSDPLNMAAKLRLSYPREDASMASLSIPFEAGKAMFDVPAQAGSTVALALLDRHGNVLQAWEVDELTAAPVVKRPIVGKIDMRSEPTPLWAKWWVWAGATGAVATVATVFGITSRSAQSDLDEVTANPGEHFYREAKALEDKAQFRANVANISFVVAGALGVTTGVMYWRGRNADSSLQVVPAGEGAGASVLLGGRF